MNYSDQFPVLDKYTYLNTANSGILSRDLAEWRKTHDQHFLETGSLFRLKRGEFLEAGRKTIAEFFNAHAGCTYLVPNFSFGFNVILEGLDSPKRFLLFKEDYPSINYAVQSRGHQCAYIPVDQFIEQTIIESIGRFNPEVLAFSLVQYSNGIKIDFDFLKKLKVNYPELFIIADGTQFCGTASFDFDNSGIDAMVSSGYKWMLGGYGNGFVLLTEEATEKLYTKEKRSALPTEGFLKDRNTLSLYFEPGHLDTLNFGTLFRAVSFLQQQGMHRIESNVSQLSLNARQAFTERELLTAAVKNRKDHSAIFNLVLPAATVKELEANRILFTARGAGIRVSFHFYNSENDLKKLIDVIDR